MKRAVIHLLLVLLGTVSALGLAEAIVILSDLAPEIVYIEQYNVQLSTNPVIGYEPKPRTALDRQYGFSGESETDREAAFRLLIIGDSVAAGQWVKREERFSRLLQKRFESWPVPVQIINFGVSGYNTRQEVEMLADRGLKYAPDMVLLQYSLNDRTLAAGDILHKLTSKERKSGGFDLSKMNRLASSSALYRYLSVRIQMARTDDEKMAPFKEDTVEESLQRLKALSQAHSFKVLVAVFPQRWHEDKYLFHSEHTLIQERAQKVGLPVVDLFSTFINCAPHDPATLFADFGHPNAAGHACAAEALGEQLEREYLPRKMTAAH